MKGTVQGEEGSIYFVNLADAPIMDPIKAVPKRLVPTDAQNVVFFHHEN